MCEFCESIKDDTKEIIWNVRSRDLDDNTCDFVNGEDCTNDCSGCQEGFRISGYDYEGNTKVGVEFFKTVKAKFGENLIIAPFSECIQWNYCPICGKQISNNILDFDKYYDHQISIYDKED